MRTTSSPFAVLVVVMSLSSCDAVPSAADLRDVRSQLKGLEDQVHALTAATAVVPPRSTSLIQLRRTPG